MSDNASQTMTQEDLAKEMQEAPMELANLAVLIGADPNAFRPQDYTPESGAALAESVAAFKEQAIQAIQEQTRPPMAIPSDDQAWNIAIRNIVIQDTMASLPADQRTEENFAKIPSSDIDQRAAEIALAFDPNQMKMNIALMDNAYSNVSAPTNTTQQPAASPQAQPVTKTVTKTVTVPDVSGDRIKVLESAEVKGAVKNVEETLHLVHDTVRLMKEANVRIPKVDLGTVSIPKPGEIDGYMDDASHKSLRGTLGFLNMEGGNYAPADYSSSVRQKLQDDVPDRISDLINVVLKGHKAVAVAEKTANDAEKVFSGAAEDKRLNQENDKIDQRVAKIDQAINNLKTIRDNMPTMVTNLDVLQNNDALKPITMKTTQQTTTQNVVPPPSSENTGTTKKPVVQEEETTPPSTTTNGLPKEIEAWNDHIGNVGRRLLDISEAVQNKPEMLEKVDGFAKKVGFGGIADKAFSAVSNDLKITKDELYEEDADGKKHLSDKSQTLLSKAVMMIQVMGGVQNPTSDYSPAVGESLRKAILTNPNFAAVRTEFGIAEAGSTEKDYKAYESALETQNSAMATAEQKKSAEAQILKFQSTHIALDQFIKSLNVLDEGGELKPDDNAPRNAIEMGLDYARKALEESGRREWITMMQSFFEDNMIGQLIDMILSYFGINIGRLWGRENEAARPEYIAATAGEKFSDNVKDTMEKDNLTIEQAMEKVWETNKEDFDKFKASKDDSTLDKFQKWVVNAVGEDDLAFAEAAAESAFNSAKLALAQAKQSDPNITQEEQLNLIKEAFGDEYFRVLDDLKNDKVQKIELRTSTGIVSYDKDTLMDETIDNLDKGAREIVPPEELEKLNAISENNNTNTQQNTAENSGGAGSSDAENSANDKNTATEKSSAPVTFTDAGMPALAASTLADAMSREEAIRLGYPVDENTKPDGAENTQKIDTVDATSADVTLTRTPDPKEYDLLIRRADGHDFPVNSGLATISEGLGLNPIDRDALRKDNGGIAPGMGKATFAQLEEWLKRAHIHEFMMENKGKDITEADWQKEIDVIQNATLIYGRDGAEILDFQWDKMEKYAKFQGEDMAQVAAIRTAYSHMARDHGSPDAPDGDGDGKGDEWKLSVIQASQIWNQFGVDAITKIAEKMKEEPAYVAPPKEEPAPAPEPEKKVEEESKPNGHDLRYEFAKSYWNKKIGVVQVLRTDDPFRVSGFPNVKERTARNALERLGTNEDAINGRPISALTDFFKQQGMGDNNIIVLDFKTLGINTGTGDKKLDGIIAHKDDSGRIRLQAIVDYKEHGVIDVDTMKYRAESGKNVSSTGHGTTSLDVVVGQTASDGGLHSTGSHSSGAAAIHVLVKGSKTEPIKKVELLNYLYNNEDDNRAYSVQYNAASNKNSGNLARRNKGQDDKSQYDRNKANKDGQEQNDNKVSSIIINEFGKNSEPLSPDANTFASQIFDANNQGAGIVDTGGNINFGISANMGEMKPGASASRNA